MEFTIPASRDTETCPSFDRDATGKQEERKKERGESTHRVQYRNQRLYLFMDHIRCHAMSYKGAISLAGIPPHCFLVRG